VAQPPAQPIDGPNARVDQMNVVPQMAEAILIAVREHHGSQGEAYDKKGQRLQTVEVGQVVLLTRR